MSRLNPDFRERQTTAVKAKQELLAKFRSAPGPDDPATLERQATRQAIVTARGVRAVEREAARIAEEKAAAARAIAEAERVARAEREAAEAAAKAAHEKREQEAALEAEQKAVRDARYAARKAAKKERRRGY